jgi:hypothetical protein
VPLDFRRPPRMNRSAPHSSSFLKLSAPPTSVPLTQPSPRKRGEGTRDPRRPSFSRPRGEGAGRRMRGEPARHRWRNASAWRSECRSDRGVSRQQCRKRATANIDELPATGGDRRRIRNSQRLPQDPLLAIGEKRRTDMRRWEGSPQTQPVLLRRHPALRTTFAPLGKGKASTGTDAMHAPAQPEAVATNSHYRRHSLPNPPPPPPAAATRPPRRPGRRRQPPPFPPCRRAVPAARAPSSSPPWSRAPRL